MKKVLIISYEYPPLNNIASRRFSELVPYLRKSGWEPYILTTKSVGDLSPNLPESNIIRIATHPESLIVSQNSSKTKPILPFSNIRKKFNLRLNSLDNSVFRWYLPVISSNIMQRIKALDIDLVIASYRPPAALMLGKRISSELNIPWIADFRDLGALYKDKYSSLPLALESLDRLNESSLIKSASAITTVSKALSEFLESNYNKETTVIYNGWVNSKSFQSGNFIDEAFKTNLPYIYYAGRFYEHRMQSIYMLIDAIVDVDILIVIRSLGPKDLEEKLVNYASQKGVSKKLIILPRSNQSIINIEQNHSTLNLVIEDLDKTYEMQKGVLTGKLMQLLTFLPPILAIAREDSEIGEVLIHSKKGKLLSQSKEINNFIISSLNTPTGTPLNSNIDEYSKERQAQKLVLLMNKVLH